MSSEAVIHDLCKERREGCTALNQQQLKELKKDFEDFKGSIKTYFTIGFTTATTIIVLVQFALSFVH